MPAGADVLLAGLCAAGGLVLLHLRLRSDHARGVTWLTLALLAGASPLPDAVLSAMVTETFAFLLFAALTVTARARLGSSARQALLLAAVALAAFVAPRDAHVSLFGSTTGFLSLTPVAYAAALGALLWARAHAAESVAALAALALWPWFDRSLTPSLPLLAPGLASLVAWLARRPLAAAAPIIIGAMVWNYWLMVQYTAGALPKDAPIRFSTMVRQQAEVATRAPYVYPFAFPGSAWAAWRAGVPWLRYDLLSTEPLRANFDLRIDRPADRFLLDGWGPLSAGREAPFRVVTPRGATLVFPLQPPDRDVDVAIVASRRGAATLPPARARVSINDATIGEVAVTENGAVHSLRIARADVGRILRAGYNRLSIVPSGPTPLAIHRLQISPHE